MDLAELHLAHPIEQRGASDVERLHGIAAHLVGAIMHALTEGMCRWKAARLMAEMIFFRCMGSGGACCSPSAVLGVICVPLFLSQSVLEKSTAVRTACS